MSRALDLAVTSTAPLIWGSSYIVATQFLPNLDPLTVSVLRALPAGLILLCLMRQLPNGHWIWKMFVLGALNFSIFWTLLFFAAYRLPGGVAAVMGIPIRCGADWDGDHNLRDQTFNDLPHIELL